MAKANANSSKNMLLLKKIYNLYPIIVKFYYKRVLMSIEIAWKSRKSLKKSNVTVLGAGSHS